MVPEFSSTACGLSVGDQPRPHNSRAKLPTCATARRVRHIQRGAESAALSTLAALRAACSLREWR